VLIVVAGDARGKKLATDATVAITSGLGEHGGDVSGQGLDVGVTTRPWFGTSPEATDMMVAFVICNGGTRAAQRADPTSSQRVGAIVERVEVPGYEPTGVS
jgi:hypothetical protein